MRAPFLMSHNAGPRFLAVAWRRVRAMPATTDRPAFQRTSPDEPPARPARKEAHENVPAADRVQDPEDVEDVWESEGGAVATHPAFPLHRIAAGT